MNRVHEEADKTGRRAFLSSAVMCAGGMVCMGCTRAVAALGEPPMPAPSASQFESDAHLTFKQVYDFAFNDNIQMLKVLEREIGPEKFLPMLQKATGCVAAEQMAKSAPAPPKNTLAAFISACFDDQYFWSHALTRTIVENSPRAYEMRVTKCLWSETFRSADAADLGYATICYPDYAAASAFNPKLRMVRTKTLMQGHEYCNHRWILDE
jgi:hypothetical protein